MTWTEANTLVGDPITGVVATALTLALLYVIYRASPLYMWVHSLVGPLERRRRNTEAEAWRRGALAQAAPLRVPSERVVETPRVVEIAAARTSRRHRSTDNRRDGRLTGAGFRRLGAFRPDVDAVDCDPPLVIDHDLIDQAVDQLGD